MTSSTEDSLCCPHCSTEECVISYPNGTHKCPICGETALLDSAVVVERIRKMMDFTVSAACQGMIKRAY
jgi:hypothetical protein